MFKSIDLRGERFGELVADFIAAKTRRGNLWACRCDCGKVALRTTAALRYTVKLGGRSACSECNAEMRAGLKIHESAARAVQLRATWDKYGVLWSAWSIERLQERVRRDLEEEYGPQAHAEVSGCSADLGQEIVSVTFQQRIFYLYPIAHEGRVWQCGDCERWFSRGLGCVACIAPVCRQCVRAEGHACAQAHALAGRDGMSLTEIARRFEVSRARVIQIWKNALHKLRRPQRLRLLVDADAMAKIAMAELVEREKNS